MSHDSSAVVKGPTLRLFLSYGRRDAAPLANRLREDLEKVGYEVWQDTRQIRAGKEWEEEIRDGLRSTQVVVALLSPHAVRRATSLVNADTLDSVCLDELSFARFAHPPTPIVPVMAIPCEPPFAVFRLDYVEMTRWLESEDQYRQGFDRLVTGIQAAARGDPLPFRRWHHCLPVLDFAALLYEKRQDFVGRQWLFDEIDAWRTASGRERALLVIGDPGIGKSAFVAEMIHRNPGGQVLAYHICRTDDPETLRPSAFIMSLAGLIAGRLPPFADLLEARRYQELFQPHAVREHPPHAFEQGLIAALHQLPAPPDGIRFILIDALDEALSLGEGQLSIVTMLATRLERLPSWLRIVATTRREPEVLNRLSALRAATITAQRPDNLTDLDQFISARLSSPNLAERLIASRMPEEAVRQQLRAKADGNFLYVSQALKDIECDNYSFDRLDELPHGIQGVYLSFFERAFPTDASFLQPRAVLEVLLAAQQPMTPAQIAGALGIDLDHALNAVLAKLSAFVDSSEGGLRLFHKSLSDWLAGDSSRVAHKFRLSKAAGHARLADACLQALDRAADSFGAVSAPHRTPVASIPDRRADHNSRHEPRDDGTDYALAHLPSHLAASGQLAELARLLTSHSYVSARVRNGQLYSLANDIHQAIALFPPNSSEGTLLTVLEQTLRREAQFVEKCRDSYPQGLFQSVFNLLKWYETAASSDASSHVGGQIAGIVQAWEQELRAQALPWLRSLRPPDLPVGVDQCFVFAGHQGEVRCLAVSRDGNLLVSGSDDGVVRVHDIQSGEVRFEWSVPGFKVIAAFVSGSRLFAVFGRERAAISSCWDISTGCNLFTANIGDVEISCGCLSADEKSLILGTSTGIYIVPLASLDHSASFDISTLEATVPECSPASFAWAPKAAKAAFGTDTCVVLLNTATARVERSIPFQQNKTSPNKLSLSPDGTLLAVATWTGWANHDSIHLIDTRTGGKIGSVRHSSENWPNSVDFSPCGNRLVSGTPYGQVRIWDRRSLSLLLEYEGHERYVVAVRFSPDGETVFSAGTDGRVLGWDVTKQSRQHRRVGHDGKIYALAVSGNQRLVASGCEACQLFVWDWENGELLFTSECLHFVTQIVFSPDGAVVATLSCEDGNLQVWNVNRGRELWHRRGAPHSGARGGKQKIHDVVNAVAFSPCSRTLACVEGGYKEQKAVVFRRSKSGEETRRIIATESDFTAVTFAARGGGFGMGCENGEVQLWTARGKRPAAIVGGLVHGITVIAIHPTEAIVIAGNNDGETAAWIREGRSWERMWYRHGPHCTGDRIVFSTDSSQVATISDVQEQLVVYDVATGKRVAEVHGICSAWHLFSAWKGGCVAESAADQTIVRSIPSGEVVGRLPVRLRMLSQNPDGTRIAGVLGRQLHMYAVETPPTK